MRIIYLVGVGVHIFIGAFGLKIGVYDVISTSIPARCRLYAVRGKRIG